ncbi:sugar O-acetyltransferase [Treponema sp.]|uniref:sugar O-acetyltransferase n=1 Tax=Treponema sp. TaxID=166 RepID=UPI00388F95E5
MTEKEKMLAGLLYDPNDAELVLLRRKAHKNSRLYNNLDETDEARVSLLEELVPNHGNNLTLQGPVQFDYGIFTTFGENCYANFNFTCIDCATVTIGSNVFFGPNVSILTPVHPMKWQERNQYTRGDGVLTDKEFARPVTIKDNCWIAGDVTICGGVTIGEGCVIGAGSVVTRDIPANVFAAGNPCRVIKQIEE